MQGSLRYAFAKKREGFGRDDRFWLDEFLIEGLVALVAMQGRESLGLMETAVL
jgi:hypothetical protein